MADKAKVLRDSGKMKSPKPLDFNSVPLYSADNFPGLTSHAAVFCLPSLAGVEGGGGVEQI